MQLKKICFLLLWKSRNRKLNDENVYLQLTQEEELDVHFFLCVCLFWLNRERTVVTYLCWKEGERGSLVVKREMVGDKDTDISKFREGKIWREISNVTSCEFTILSL